MSLIADGQHVTTLVSNHKHEIAFFPRKSYEMSLLSDFQHDTTSLYWLKVYYISVDGNFIAGDGNCITRDMEFIAGDGIFISCL